MQIKISDYISTFDKKNINVVCLWQAISNCSYQRRVQISHFTVACLVTWPVTASEAGGGLALIQTSLLFSCKCRLVSIRTT